MDEESCYWRLAGGNDSIHAGIHRHLAVVVERVPPDDVDADSFGILPSPKGLSISCVAFSAVRD